MQFAGFENKFSVTGQTYTRKADTAIVRYVITLDTLDYYLTTFNV